MNWKKLTIVFIATIVLLLGGNAIAQTDFNINNINLIRLGGSVTVAEKQVVENAIAIGGSAIVQPNGRVTQTAIAIGGDVILNKGARVDGDAYAVRGKVVQKEGATIGGANGTFNDRSNGQSDRNYSLSMYFVHASLRIASAYVGFIVGNILLRATPSFLPNLAATVHQYPGQSILWGMGAIVTFVALNIFLAITLIGIPLIPFLSIIFALASLVGALGFSLFIGQQVVKNDRQSNVYRFLIGLLIVTVLALIPFIGGIVVFVVSVVGLGSLLTWKFGKVQPPFLID